MNGFNAPFTTAAAFITTEHLLPDFLNNMSSPSGSSDSMYSTNSSPGIPGRMGRRNIYTATSFNPKSGNSGINPGKNMNLMAKVQKQSSSSTTTSTAANVTNKNQLANSGKRNANSSSNTAIASNQHQPVAAAAAGGAKQQTTDLFLTQFQHQIIQMKNAMDAVQNEMLNTISSNNNKGNSPKRSSPLVSSSFSPMSSVVITQSSPGPGRPRTKPKNPVLSTANNASTLLGASAAATTYHSQISTTNGLKLKIKKSKGNKRGAHLRGRKKTKKRKDQDEEDDEVSDDDEEEFDESAKSDELNFSSSNIETPSKWGDSLPENILFKIFSIVVNKEGCVPFLVRASKVSRLWSKVASKTDLWTNIDLSTRVKDVYRSERNLIYFLENRFFQAKELNLGGWSSGLTNNAIDVLVRKCKDLESLGVSGCQKLTSSNLKTITESCSLRKIDLSAISSTYNTKSAVSPLSISEASEILGDRLNHLSLANNCLANCPQIITSLSENCPNLQVLDLSNVSSPRRDSIVIKIEQLQNGCSELKILRLTNTEILLAETSLKDQANSKGFPNLEELSIAVDPKRCPGMDDGDLERIIKNSNKLRLLDIRGCTKITDRGLVRVPAWDLEHLYISGCFASKPSNDGLELVVKKWSHSLIEVDFSWTPNEINIAIKALSDEDNEETKRPLEILNLCGSSATLTSVKLALSVCPNLKRLNLTSCRALPRGIKRNYIGFNQVSALREQVNGGKFDETSE